MILAFANKYNKHDIVVHFLNIIVTDKTDKKKVVRP